MKISITNRITLIILLVGFLIRIPLIPISLNCENDNWRQTDTASIAHHFLINGFKILYPQIYWGGGGPGYVETEFQLYPFLVALLYAVFGEHTSLGRLVSCLFTFITIIIFYLFARLILKPREVLWALILFVLSPLLLRYSAAFMPEATVMCFYLGGLYFFTRWLREQRPAWLFLASISTALAILVKPTAIHIGLLFLLLAVKQLGRGVFKNGRIWLAALFCLLPVVLYYWHARNVYLEYGNTFGILSGGDSKFGNLFYWTSPDFYIGVVGREAKWVFTPLAALVFLIGFVQALKRRQYLLIYGVITIGLYFFILARFSGYQRGIQYHIYMIPYAAIGFGIGVESLLKLNSRFLGRLMALAAILSVMAWTGVLYSKMVNPPEPKSLISCANQIQKLIPSNAYMIVSSYDYSVDIDAPSISNNYQEPMLFFYSQRYGWSLPADWLKPDTLEKLRKEGAGYYVVLDRDKDLLYSHPEVLDYLKTEAKILDSGIEEGCDIYRFNQ